MREVNRVCSVFRNALRGCLPGFIEMALDEHRSKLHDNSHMD